MCEVWARGRAGSSYRHLCQARSRAAAVPDPLAGICARLAAVPDPLTGICARLIILILFPLISKRLQSQSFRASALFYS